MLAQKIAGQSGGGVAEQFKNEIALNPKAISKHLEPSLSINSLPIYAPQQIEKLSMQIIDHEVLEPRPFSGQEWEVARRLVHTTADFDFLYHLHFQGQAIEAGVAALLGGCTIFTDTEMACCGIPLRRLNPLGCKRVCLLARPGAQQKIAQTASQDNITRSQAAMQLAATLLNNQIVALGNAPTALLKLIELIQKGAALPALVVAMPVGFVNAAESKDLLLAACPQIPAIVIRGRKGGSPLAAATVNALAEIALRERQATL